MADQEYQTITITYQERPGSQREKWYRILVDGGGDLPNLWVEPGWYKNFEDVVQAFSYGLKADLQLRILEELAERGTTSFGLENAHDCS